MEKSIQKLKRWFNKRKHPRSRLYKNKFFFDLLKLIGLILIFLLVYSNIDKINQIVLLFIKLGSLIQIILLFFILRKLWHLAVNLRYGFQGLNNGTKTILLIFVVIILLIVFLNQEQVIASISTTYDKINFQSLNPIQSLGNLSMLNYESEPKEKVLIDFSPTNQENYIGENVKAKGILSLVVKGGWLSWDKLSLEDTQGYQIELKGCVPDLWNDDISETRDLKVGEKYTAIGFLNCEKTCKCHTTLSYLNAPQDLCPSRDFGSKKSVCIEGEEPSPCLVDNTEYIGIKKTICLDKPKYNCILQCTELIKN